jgi:hypothetical protein
MLYPPKDASTIEYIGKSFRKLPNGSQILLEYLKADLNNPRNDQSEVVATAMSDLGLENWIDHFRQKRVYDERYMWRMMCNTAVVRARCD